MNDIIRAEGLGKKFEGFALRDVSFALPAGYIMGLIGPNGAGKTTTISLLLGRRQPDAGRAEILGLDCTRDAIAIRKQVGMVGDSCYFCAEWTVRECGRALSVFYESWSGERFRALCARFGLEPERRVRELSKGMRMKLMVSAALAHETRLLILDEPTSGLDPVSRDELLELLARYIEDGTRSVLFSTHITQDLERAADYITCLRDGKVFFTGEKQALLDRYVLAKGGPEELTPALLGALTGLRRYSAGFEGLLPAEDARRFPGLALDRVTLDDIIVRTHEKREGGDFDA